ncbi:MAG: HAMP domain-containing histidine kinase [Kiritimatiellae bacterium]|nr:HAMP domain-containing histidine kinase [Kiritimatiellia bacterium]
MYRVRLWLAPTVAAAAFALALGVFVAALWHYFRRVNEWSADDLRSRAEMTAAALAEPLRTLDFRAIDATAARLKRDRLRLRICAGQRFYVTEGEERQGFYDTLGEPNPPDLVCQWGVASAGDFQVGVGRPVGQMLLPFLGALAVVVVAGLVGILALGAVFFVLYRQRVRIRELARLEKFRRDFVADVSHEIKTPLTGILGAVDMLEGDSPLVPLIRKEATRLNGLVQSILDLARLEREGEALNRTETDLSDLVRDVASRYPCECEAGEPCVVACDAQLVSQALSNLIANAVRHSGSKEISVSLTQAGGEARIVVEDHGVGIPPAEAERVFERFHRVDPARAAETGGAGLGLAIVRRIARLHGGDVSLSAAKPHGCRFYLSIPLT